MCFCYRWDRFDLDIGLTTFIQEVLISQTISKIPHLKDHFSYTNYDSNNEHTGTMRKCRFDNTYEIKTYTELYTALNQVHNERH